MHAEKSPLNATIFCKVWITISLVPRLPQFFSVTRRKTREPGKIYHVRDIGVEATWSAAHANHDSAVFDGNCGAMKDRRFECTNDCSAIYVDHLRLSFAERRLILLTSDRRIAPGHSRRLVVPRADYCAKVA